MPWLFEPSVLELTGIVLVLTHITIISVTVYLHRYSSHRALELNPVLKHFFRFWLWLTTGMTTKAWTAIHRKHHAMCETEDDPHSPQVLGLNEVLWRGSELYRKEAKNDQTLQKYGQGTPDDWLERKLYTPHDTWGITLLFIINIACFGPIGITVAAIQLVWIPFFAAGVINGLAHYWGYRNFESNDASRNISPLGILIGGEELHNNHHTYPNSAKLSSKWWEFDIGWFYIRLFESLGLAKVKKIPPVLYRDWSKTEIDRETIMAVINARFQVMANYRKNVIAPVIAEEKAKATESSRELFKRAKKLMTREITLIDDSNKQRLNQLLDSNANLQTIYEYRMRLQEIWSKASQNSNELIQQLKDWCAEAEATGIQALQEFADSVKAYSLQPQPVR